MNQIQHLECEIQEYKIELEQHQNAIRNLNCFIDNTERKIEFLKRKETLEKYKPRLEGYVDKYIHRGDILHPFNPNIKLYTIGIDFNPFDAILLHFKNLKEKGLFIYVYKIDEPTTTKNYYGISYLTFKKEEND